MTGSHPVTAQHGKTLRSRLDQVSTQHHALGLTPQRPIRKGVIDCRIRDHSGPPTLEVEVHHVQELLTITQNAGYRLLDWRLEEAELAPPYLPAATVKERPFLLIIWSINMG